MKYVTVALLFCAVASMSHAFCLFKEITPDMTHCMDNIDGTWHAVGSTWINSGCMKCSCESCCSIYSIPKQFPEDCVSVFNKTACAYTVHKKDNPAILCPIYGAVGK